MASVQKALTVEEGESPLRSITAREIKLLMPDGSPLLIGGGGIRGGAIAQAPPMPPAGGGGEGASGPRLLDLHELYGIHGSPFIDGLEKARVRRARRLARLDPFGLRYKLPEGFDTRLRALLKRRSRPAVSPDAPRLRYLQLSLTIFKSVTFRSPASFSCSSLVTLPVTVTLWLTCGASLTDVLFNPQVTIR